MPMHRPHLACYRLDLVPGWATPAGIQQKSLASDIALRGASTR
jgi:hypothetical protein